jgi:hypothetical protein
MKKHHLALFGVTEKDSKKSEKSFFCIDVQRNMRPFYLANFEIIEVKVKYKQTYRQTSHIILAPYAFAGGIFLV